MWAVAICPRCNRQVAVPTVARADSIMRCPLCRNEYPLEEALNNLPPELEIVSNTQPASEPIEVMPVLPFEMSTPLTVAPTAPNWQAPREPDFQAPVVPESFSAAPMIQASFTDEFVPPEEAPRAVRPQKSAVRTMVEVLIGGLLAGPLALLIIMWCFGRDPLHMADKLPQFLVPPSLRSGPEKQEPVILDVN